MHKGPAWRAELQAGLNPHIKHSGFLNDIIQILIFMWFILFNGNVMKACVFDPPTSVNSLVLSRKEICIQCSGEFPKVFVVVCVSLVIVKDVIGLQKIVKNVIRQNLQWILLKSFELSQLFKYYL